MAAKFASMEVPAVLGVLLVVFAGLSAGDVPCTFSETRPCHCKTDNLTLHIGTYLKYPVQHINDTYRPYKYYYEYSPCKLIDCGDGVANAHACQTLAYDTSRFYIVGLGVDKWTIHHTDPLSFTVQYKGFTAGGVNRSSSVTFVYADTMTTIAMTHETPDHFFSFIVQGRTVVPYTGEDIFWEEIEGKRGWKSQM